jgi:hypothetical protein
MRMSESHEAAISHVNENVAKMSVGTVTLGSMKRDMPSALVRLQQGVFSRKQALQADLTHEMIDSRVRSGTWRVVHRGVYTAAAGDLGRPAELWAAVLYAGHGAVLSHETAAEKLAFGGRPVDEIHLTIPGNRTVKAPPETGMRFHRSRRANQAALADCYPPCTSAEETVLDLVDAASTFDEMCGWVTRALTRKRTTAVELRGAMDKRGRLRWHPVLNGMITATITGDQSVLEHGYERDVERAHGLPEPELQVPFTTKAGTRGRRDRAYPAYRVVIELDGLLYHAAEDVWHDKERDNAAIESGYEPLRYGWKHVTQQACATAIQVARVLRAHGWTGKLHPCSADCPVRYENMAA